MEEYDYQLVVESEAGRFMYKVNGFTDRGWELYGSPFHTVDHLGNAAFAQAVYNPPNKKAQKTDKAKR